MGRIRRVELRKRETEIRSSDGGETTASTEFADTDFPNLRALDE